MKVELSVHLLTPIHSIMRRIETPRQSVSLMLHQKTELLTAWDRHTKTADREIVRFNAIK